MAGDRLLDGHEWDTLLERIRAGECVPVLGAGATAGIIPLGAEMAGALAEEYRYPFEDADDLPAVTEFLGVKFGREFPKQTILEKWFRDLHAPDLRAPDEPHSVLADLALPLYLTTNYDPLMAEALKLRGKSPRREVCPWNDAARHWQEQQFAAQPDGFDPSQFSPQNPVVFHLHGIDQLPESLVLTENDYIDFLAYFTNRLEDLFPDYIRRALETSTLLIIGYSLADVNFRAILRSFVHRPGDVSHFTVQYPPPDDDEKRGYIEEYFAKSMNLRVIWSSAEDFATELEHQLHSR